MVINSKPENAQLLFVEVQPYKRLRAASSQTIPELPLALMAKVQAKLGLYNELLSEILTQKLVSQYTETEFQAFYDGSVMTVPALRREAEKLQMDFFGAVEKCQKSLVKFSSKLPEQAEKLCTDDLEVLTAQKIANVSLKRKP